MLGVGTRRVALVVLCLAVGGGFAARAQDAKKKLETNDFNVTVPAGWTGKVHDGAHVASSVVILDNAAGNIRVLVNVASSPFKAGTAEEKEELKLAREAPGMWGAAFVMPMALKMGGDAILTLYDEVVVAGDPTPACRVVVTKGEHLASLHGMARMMENRFLSIAIVTKRKQDTAEPDKVHMRAVSEAYALIRELRLKKR